MDITAEHDGEQILVEVKGYPSTLYARGDRPGQPKPTGSATQARVWFATALLSGLTMRSEHPDSHVVLAFPDMGTYRNLARKVRPALESCAIEVWLVSQDRLVEIAFGSDPQGGAQSEGQSRREFF